MYFFAEARIFFQVVPYNLDVTIIEFKKKKSLFEKIEEYKRYKKENNLTASISEGNGSHTI